MAGDREDELMLEKRNTIITTTGSPTDCEEVWIEKELSSLSGDYGN